MLKIDKYTIHISDEVLSILNKYKQDKNQNESGGIILGSVHKDNHIYISKISEPNALDKSSRCGFERDKRQHKILLMQSFTILKGDHLGNSTHPEKITSFVDIRMIKQQYKVSKINENF